MNQTLHGAGNAAVHEVAGWVPPLARMGYAAKGVVYALVGIVAIRAAMASGQAGGATEALAGLADGRGGRMVLLLVAIGLLGHVLWRLVQALLDPEHDERSAKRVAVRMFFALSAVIYGSLAATAWQLSRGNGGGGNGGSAEGDGQQIWIAALLAQPFGTWLVMLAGIGVFGFGLHQLYKAWRGDVNRHMGPRDAEVARWQTLVGRIGTAARGVVLLPIGWFVFQAGRAYRAEAAAGSGEVLRMIEHSWLLAAIGLGLLAYGVHQGTKAIYRRIERVA